MSIIPIRFKYAESVIQLKVLLNLKKFIDLHAEKKHLNVIIMAKKAKKAAPKKKAAGATRTSYIAKAPIRRLMKNEGAGLVAENAVVLLIETLTKAGTELTKSAVKLVKADKRKRVTAADVIQAGK